MKPEHRRPNVSAGGRARPPVPKSTPSGTYGIKPGAPGNSSSSTSKTSNGSVSGSSKNAVATADFAAAQYHHDEVVDIYRDPEGGAFRHTRKTVSFPTPDDTNTASFFESARNDESAPRVRFVVLEDGPDGGERHKLVNNLTRSLHAPRMRVVELGPDGGERHSLVSDLTQSLQLPPPPSRDTVMFAKSPLISTSLHSDGKTLICASDTLYRVSLANFLVVWSCPDDLECIYGIIVHQGEQSRELASLLIGDIVAHQSLMLNPVLPAYFAQGHMAHAIEDWFICHVRDVTDAAEVTGNHHNLDIGPGKRRKYDAGELSAKLSGAAYNMATNQNCWEGLLELSLFIIDELDAIEPQKCDGVVQDRIPNIRSIRQRSLCIAQKAKAMCKEAASWQTKASIQLHGLFNQIAQDNQNFSKKIAFNSLVLAEDSKRESTSMKAIAAVTMFFLPGTFAAVSFNVYSILARPSRQVEPGS